MKTIRLTEWTVPLLIPALILTQVGCGASPTDGSGGAAEGSTSSPATGEHPRDGETVFRGVFFGQGPVASLFPETWNGTKTVAPAGTLTNEGLVTALSAQIERMTTEGQSPAAIAKLTMLRKQLQDGSLDATTLAASTKYDAVLVDAKVERVIAAMKSTDPTFFDSFGVDVQSGDHVRVQNAYLRARKAFLGAAASSDLASNAGGSQTGDCLILIDFIIRILYVDLNPATTTGHSLEEEQYVDLMATRLANR